MERMKERKQKIGESMDNFCTENIKLYSEVNLNFEGSKNQILIGL